MMMAKEKKKKKKADKGEKAAKKTKAKKAPKKKKAVKAKDPVEVQKQRWTVYTSMNLVSLLAVIIACVFLHLELDSYQYKIKPTAADIKVK